MRCYEPDGYRYIENGSKNKCGVNPKERNKVVTVYADPLAQPRCLVYLLDKYLSKLPQRAKDMDIFYMRPISSSKDCTTREVWYECAPVGKEKLRKFLGAMCEDAGLSNKKTNHSLRANGATALFNAGGS